MSNQRQIPYRAVKAAHKLHRSGMSMAEISRLIYRRYGYTSSAACTNTLRRAFRHYGMRITPSPEMTRLLQKGRRCLGCGVDIYERTPSCTTCSQRHSAYRRSGRPFVPAVCRGCACDLDEKTVGCARCRKRHSLRNQRKRAAASFEAGTGLSVSLMPQRGVDGKAAAPTLKEAA